MNDLTTRQNTAIATQNANPFEAYGNAVSQRTIVGDLLKFSKGDYTAGQDDKEVPEGTELVANMDQLLTGWVRWENNAPSEQMMGLVADGHIPPSRRTLGDTDEKEWDTDSQGRPRDPWQLTNYLILKSPGSDKLYTFATSSRGGLNAIGELCKVYGRAMRQRPNEYPIIALNVDSYRHSNKEFGKIYTPKFDVVGWVPKAEFAAALAEDEKAESAETPKTNGRSKSAPAAETRF